MFAYDGAKLFFKLHSLSRDSWNNLMQKWGMRKNNEQPEKFYTTLDAYQAGFLTLQGFTPKLVDQGGKIVFVFIQSAELLKELADYSAGAVVEAARFAFTIKTLKSQIHSMRRGKEEADVKLKSGRGIRS
jgi:hypothetical protein